MPIKSRATSANILLSGLSKRDRDRILADCVNVDLVLGSVLYEAGDRLRHVYFPTTSFISILMTLDEKSVIEVGMIGAEGMCGSEVAFGAPLSSLRALVQGAGMAWKMESTAFLGHLKTVPALRQTINSYLNVLLCQLYQTAACTRFHLVEGRLARWLLMTSDRAHSDSFEITQEFLAYMLGVRRAGVTGAAGALQDRELIRYRRGKLSILNRKDLEAAACSCYRSDLQTYTRNFAKAP